MKFIQGRILSSRFYKEVIQLLLTDTPHDAALIGEGSDVLGFDQPISTDHDWGPKVTIFVSSNDESSQYKKKYQQTYRKSFMDL